MIKAIIFDCFGVLTTDTWRAFVDSLPPEVSSERARELNRQLDSGFINHQEFKEQIFELTGRQPIEVEKLLDNEIVKNAQLLDYIRDLKERGYKIGLLSNISSNWIRSTLLTEAEAELFDEMVLSYEVGMTKPDRRVYLLICERLRVSTHEAVMIDDIAGYCEAAHTEGLSAVTYEDNAQLKAELEKILAADPDH